MEKNFLVLAFLLCSSFMSAQNNYEIKKNSIVWNGTEILVNSKESVFQVNLSEAKKAKLFCVGKVQGAGDFAEVYTDEKNNIFISYGKKYAVLPSGLKEIEHIPANASYDETCAAYDEKATKNKYIFGYDNERNLYLIVFSV